MIESIIAIIVIWVICKLPEWRSDHRTTPPGYHHDYKKANYDLVTKGKDYYYQQHNAGKYDVPDKK